MSRGSRRALLSVLVAGVTLFAFEGAVTTLTGDSLLRKLPPGDPLVIAIAGASVPFGFELSDTDTVSETGHRECFADPAADDPWLSVCASDHRRLEARLLQAAETSGACSLRRSRGSPSRLPRASDLVGQRALLLPMRANAQAPLEIKLVAPRRVVMRIDGALAPVAFRPLRVACVPD